MGVLDRVDGWFHARDANWFRDPTDPKRVRRRYWDGDEWTDLVLLAPGDIEPLVMSVEEAQRRVAGEPQPLAPPVERVDTGKQVEKLVADQLSWHVWVGWAVMGIGILVSAVILVIAIAVEYMG